MKFRFLFLAIVPIHIFSQAIGYTGTWNGQIDDELPIQFIVSDSEEDLSAAMIKPEMIMLVANVNNGTLSLNDSSGQLIFRGSISEDKNEMIGEITLNDEINQISLRRGNKKIYRPQEPAKPYPYHSEEITFFNNKDCIKLSGTLTLPRGSEPFPAVIFISGSSPVDRNGEANFHKSQLVIADYLTRNGIAVLRYDDRGVGKSEGSFYKSTSEDFAQDVISVLKNLRAMEEIDAKKIGLIGHSAGGIVGSIAAAKDPNINFLILLASPGIDLKKLALLQIERQFEVGDLSEEAYLFRNKFFTSHYRWLEAEKNEAFITDSLETFKNEYIASIRKETERDSLRTIMSFVSLVQQSVSTYNTYNLNNPINEKLKKVCCSVLSLNGSKDIKVPAKINQQGIREALKEGGNPDFTIIELKGLNHSFRKSNSGSMKEDINIQQTFSPEALSVMMEWIKSKTE